MRSPRAATREQPLLIATRESQRVTKPQHSQKKKKDPGDNCLGLKHFRLHNRQHRGEDIFREGPRINVSQTIPCTCKRVHILSNTICSTVEMAQNLQSGDINLNPGSVTHSFCPEAKQWHDYIFRKHKSILKTTRNQRRIQQVIGYKIYMQKSIFTIY